MPMMMDALIGTNTAPQGGNSIPAPEGFTLPDEVQEGQPFEAVVKLRLSEGQITFDEINGVKLGGEAEAPEVEEMEETETETVEETPAGAEEELTLEEAIKQYRPS